MNLEERLLLAELEVKRISRELGEITAIVHRMRLNGLERPAAGLSHFPASGEGTNGISAQAARADHDH